MLNYSSERAETILDEMLSQVVLVIETVSEKLPKKFPTQIAKSIFDGMLQIKRNLIN